MAPLSKISIWYLQQMSLSFHTHTDIQNTTSKPTNKHTFPATHHTTLMQQIIIHNDELFEKASLQEFIKEKLQNCINCTSSSFINPMQYKDQF